MSHLHCTTIYSKEIIKEKELFIKKKQRNGKNILLPCMLKNK